MLMSISESNPISHRNNDGAEDSRLGDTIHQQVSRQEQQACEEGRWRRMKCGFQRAKTEEAVGTPQKCSAGNWNTKGLSGSKFRKTNANVALLHTEKIVPLLFE